MRTLCVFGACIALLLTSASSTPAEVKVNKGYYKKDGTYVPPSYRSSPDKSKDNNLNRPGVGNPYKPKIK